MVTPLSKAPIAERQIDARGFPTRAVANWQRDVTERLKSLETGAAIANADGTLADLTTKFNALLAELRAAGVIR